MDTYELAKNAVSFSTSIPLAMYRQYGYAERDKDGQNNSLDNLRASNCSVSLLPGCKGREGERLQ